MRLLRILPPLAALAGVSSPALAQDYPLTFQHKFGTTVIEEAPERVASVDYAGLGNLLAIGVQPVLVRDWRDNYAFAAGPWAAPAMTTEPVMISGAIDPETVAATDPDVIIALWSGIDAAMYDRLSLIAPVVAVPEGVGDYALSWDKRAQITGRAIGKGDEAERQIATIEDRLEDIRTTLPEWEGKTAVVMTIQDGQFNAYTFNDVRAQFITSLGFELPEALNAMTGDEFHVLLSPEEIAPVNADVIVWYGASDGLPEALGFPARRFLDARDTGGEVFLTDDMVAAFARVTLLSIPAVLDDLVPMLEAAADGDPATVVDGDLH